MAAQHTPGPWSVVPYGDGDSLAVHDARGDWRVCFMATPGDSGDMAGIEANARLIAAAPELLALAYQYRDDLRYPPAPDSKERRLAAIDAVLTKIGEG